MKHDHAIMKCIRGKVAPLVLMGMIACAGHTARAGGEMSLWDGPEAALGFSAYYLENLGHISCPGLSLGLLGVAAEDGAVFSYATLINTQAENYFLALSPFSTLACKNYGVQIACVNMGMGNCENSWQGLQVGLYNSCGTIQVGFSNEDGSFQFGVLNTSKWEEGVWQFGVFNGTEAKGLAFQIGLLNFNKNGPAPILPFINFVF